MCTVLLVAHPLWSGTVGNGGNGTSGSTDWRNSVRALPLLETVSTELTPDGNGGMATAPALIMGRLSYAPAGGRLWLKRHWESDGVQLAWILTIREDAAAAHGQTVS